VEVLGASKKQQQQLKGIYRTQNDGGTGSLKECKGTAEECRRGGGDNLTGAVEKELNCADEIARLNGHKPRDGGKILEIDLLIKIQGKHLLDLTHVLNTLCLRMISRKEMVLLVLVLYFVPNRRSRNSSRTRCNQAQLSVGRAFYHNIM
jgi:hypothetical protein